MNTETIYRPPEPEPTQVRGPEPQEPKPQESKIECEIPENLFVDKSMLVR
jgi:hypothetical protein